MTKEERTEVIGVRVSPRDRRVFEKAAKEADMTLSEFLRAAALTYMAMTLNPDALKMLARGLVGAVEDGLKNLKHLKEERLGKALGPLE